MEDLSISIPIELNPDHDKITKINGSTCINRAEAKKALTAAFNVQRDAALDRMYPPKTKAEAE